VYKKIKNGIDIQIIGIYNKSGLILQCVVFLSGENEKAIYWNSSEAAKIIKEVGHKSRKPNRRFILSAFNHVARQQRG